jgi:hypothetical protein
MPVSKEWVEKLEHVIAMNEEYSFKQSTAIRLCSENSAGVGGR